VHGTGQPIVLRHVLGKRRVQKDGAYGEVDGYVHRTLEGHIYGGIHLRCGAGEVHVDIRAVDGTEDPTNRGRERQRA